MSHALRLLLVGAAIGFLVGLVTNERKHKRSLDAFFDDPENQKFIERSKNDPRVRWNVALEDAINGS
jgi:hypothetical protein